jgi:oligopeptide transport system substrate-binding protein
MHWSNLQSRQYDLSIGGWAADYADPSTFLDLFAKNSGFNFTGWNDAAYDTLNAAANADLDPTTRLEKLQRCEALLLEAMPVIPFEFPLSRTLKQPSVRDWRTNANGLPDYTSPWLAPL